MQWPAGGPESNLSREPGGAPRAPTAITVGEQGVQGEGAPQGTEGKGWLLTCNPIVYGALQRHPDQQKVLEGLHHGNGEALVASHRARQAIWHPHICIGTYKL